MTDTKQDLNLCDWGHETRGEVRLLPTGGDGNALACLGHYNEAIENWQENFPHIETPEWESLKIVNEAIAEPAARPDTGSTPAAYKLTITSSQALTVDLEGRDLHIALPDTGGKTSHAIHIEVQAYGTKPKTFALVVTQNGFIKTERID